ncbi:NAD(P)-dependent oxidoreductase [Streptomyces sp. NPDC001978]|uniref:NAD(P)-dependent oxidoreductase n=1 Tax=Streptomyces sp. NPDC001978 TaxID=3364627 RepID=UPI0036B22DA8
MPSSESVSPVAPTDVVGKQTPIGFVGLGDMGGRMALHIAGAGFPLAVFDTRPSAVEELTAVGAHGCAGLTELADRCEVVGVCVVDDEQVLAVVGELLPALRPGATVLVHSSVLPATMHAVAATAAERDVTVVDAPVSGSRPAADAGSLTVLVGAAEPVIARLQPLFDCYASHVIRAGDLGAGQLLKIANNVLLHMNHLVAVEAARFARAHGIGEEAFITAANVSTGRSWVTETWGLIDDMLVDHPLAGTQAVFEIMSKEMWHAVEISRASLTPLELTALGTQLSRAYCAERLTIRAGAEAESGA